MGWALREPPHPIVLCALKQMHTLATPLKLHAQSPK
jgi:hypothetical protein